MPNLDLRCLAMAALRSCLNIDAWPRKSVKTL